MKRTFLLKAIKQLIILSITSIQFHLYAGEGRDYSLGTYIVSIDQHSGSIDIVDQRFPANLLFSASLDSLLRAGHSEIEIAEGRGNFRVENENLRFTCRTAWREVSHNNGSLRISGELKGDADECLGEISFELKQSTEKHLNMAISSTNETINYWEFSYQSHKDEAFYGFGMQYSYFDLKGKNVPILVREQGVGRGHPLITPIVNANSDGWGGGSPLHSYYVSPQYLSSDNRGFFLNSTNYSEFDLSQPELVKLRVFDERIDASVFGDNNLLGLVSSLSEWTGRMNQLPEWVNNGAILGLQGGTEKVRNIVDDLLDLGTPIAAVWLQDWVGQRETSVGQQLWWNWELDQEHYPEWEELLRYLRSKGIRVIGYINPFLVNVSGDPMDDPNYPSRKDKFRRNLFEEADRLGFLVKNKEGSAYRNMQTSFGAYLVDISNEEAREWLKDIIKENLIGSGLSGWMADFAEALPYDAVLDAEEASTYHNRYPQEWAKLNREAIIESGLSHEILTFHRSGFSKSPKYAGLFWQGDQMVTWDEHDGIKTAITSMLGSGFSGVSLNHSDIGGYAGFKVWGLGYSREQSLLMRWMEMNAFTAAFRSHEGNQPANNHQVYSSLENMKAFSRQATIFKALKPYRMKLIEEAAALGLPVVRHPIMHFPNDHYVKDIMHQFMLGDQFMVCPVLDKRANEGHCYLPEGSWVHLWSGKVIYSSGQIQKDYAPYGEMPVYYPVDSREGQALRDRLRTLGTIH